MLYEIEGKYYIRVSGYYKEVEVLKAKDGFEVKPTANANKTKIEASTVKNYTTISLEKAYEKKNKGNL